MPITERFGFQGECYIGENLGAFLGGIGQGIDPTGLNTIRDAGGWFELWYDWTPRCTATSATPSTIRTTTTCTPSARRRYNQFYFGNLSLRPDEELLDRHGSQLVEDALRRPTARRFGPLRVRGEVRVLNAAVAGPLPGQHSRRLRLGRQLNGCPKPRRRRQEVAVQLAAPIGPVLFSVSIGGAKGTVPFLWRPATKIGTVPANAREGSDWATDAQRAG